MATVATLGSKVRSLLDDDASTSPRYALEQDIIPAMNLAIEYLVAVFSAGFDSKQIKPDILHNLIKAKAFAATVNGVVAKVDISSLSMDTAVWRIIGVEPNPTMDGDDISVIQAKMAGRLTLEQWNHSQENPFMRGSISAVPDDFMETAYTGPGKFYGDDTDYILLRPASVLDDTTPLVAVYYLAAPSILASSSDTIDFPVSLHNVIVQKTVQYLSFQHGPNDKYFQATDKEIKEIMSLMNV